MDKYQVISINSKKMKNDFLKSLDGRVFHVTSIENFVSICQTGAIESNNGKRKANWKGVSYFANRNCVSVCDLYNNKKKRVSKNKMLSDYNIFEQFTPSVFLFLYPKYYDFLISWEEWKRDKAYFQKVIPNLESGYPDRIPIEYIEEVVFLSRKKVGSFNSCDIYI
jgi:hypothetical protein